MNTCNPCNFDIPALWFPCKDPVNPSKHLQCSSNTLLHLALSQFFWNRRYVASSFQHKCDSQEYRRSKEDWRKTISMHHTQITPLPETSGKPSKKNTKKVCYFYTLGFFELRSFKLLLNRQGCQKNQKDLRITTTICFYASFQLVVIKAMAP